MRICSCYKCIHFFIPWIYNDFWLVLHIGSKGVVFETEALYLCVLLFKMISIHFFLYFSFGHLLTLTICNKSFLIINKKEYFSGTREKCTIPHPFFIPWSEALYRTLLQVSIPEIWFTRELLSPGGQKPSLSNVSWADLKHGTRTLLVAACAHSLFPHSDTPLWPSLSSKHAFDSPQMKIKF